MGVMGYMEAAELGQAQHADPQEVYNWWAQSLAHGSAPWAYYGGFSSYAPALWGLGQGGVRPWWVLPAALAAALATFRTVARPARRRAPAQRGRRGRRR